MLGDGGVGDLKCAASRRDSVGRDARGIRVAQGRMAGMIGKGKSCNSNDNMQPRSSACSSAPESDEDTSHHLPPVHGYLCAFSGT